MTPDEAQRYLDRLQLEAYEILGMEIGPNGYPVPKAEEPVDPI
jgi:hypothetical protein